MDIREIEYEWADDGTRHISDVVVGDGTIDYGDEFDEFDPRIFYYFQDEEEFQRAFTKGVEEFTIVRVL